MKDAILIALAKKHKPEMEDDEEMSAQDDHLMEIAKDLVEAIHDKDAGAVADLLKEAFECLKGEY